MHPRVRVVLSHHLELVPPAVQCCHVGQAPSNAAAAAAATAAVALLHSLLHAVFQQVQLLPQGLWEQR
jgi:hypothetical protein